MFSTKEFDRDRMIGDFWETVRRDLVDKYKKSPDQADLGIGRYRRELYLREIGDLVYHQGDERTAYVVNGIIDNGLPGDT